MWRIVCCLLLSFSLTGCFTSYRTSGAPVRFGENCHDVLHVGRTSRAQVLQLFGAPTDIHATQQGDTFRYLYVREIADGVNVGLSALWGFLSLSLFRSEAGHKDTDNLTIFFDRAGMLQAYSFSAAFPDEQ